MDNRKQSKRVISRPKPKRAFTPAERKPARQEVSSRDEPMRLNKYIAHCGVCARRQAAEFVKQGLVSVNDQVEINPGYLVQPADVVKFKGKPIKPEEKKVYLLMNKPKGVITTASDEKGRKTVLDIIGQKVPERIFPVGRLDRMTTGLLLLTNDGNLAKKLSHPSHKVTKFYHAVLNKPLSRPDLEAIQKGLKLDDGIAQVDGIDYAGDKKNEVGIELHIGKNRIIRRIFEHLGYEVERLDRTYYAGLTKKDLGRGHFRHLTEQEVIMLKHFK
jgi:23S rRNA pseudouridine2605 synthase